ncbi:histone-lysine N-methyltransferase [Elysia marginata]|uniref:Histone-lysine N-methyltransferase n=1 Tax=Elysia marginata TaxID=1093978 RepID=A0AAV4JUB5_9GAST|nr:histone-lysine N-methyltransferase [Elysia marginata]
MEDNSRNGKTGLIQDDENSNASSKSVNSVGEEFSVGNLITDGGLKLTISCRTKSCENELDKNCNDTLGSSPRTNLITHKDYVKHASVSVNEVTTMENENPLNLDLPKEHPELKLGSQDLDGKTKAEARPMHAHQQKLSKTVDFAMSQTEVQVQLKPACKDGGIAQPFQGGPKPDDRDNLELSSLKFQQDSEGAKQQVSLGLKNNDILCGPEIHHDPLLRIDTLPNVSPESGISSLDESPFGNESPDFTNTGETSDQFTSVPSSTHSVKSIKTTEAAPHARHPYETLLQSDTVGRVSNVNKSQVEKSTSGFVDKDKVVQEMSVPEVKYSLTENQTDANVVQDRVEPALPTLTHGGHVIVSSPHKISQSTGRKKRGRPPKPIKSHLLKHKKSTLYNHSVDTCSISETQKINFPLDEENSEDQASDNGNQCEINNSNSCDMVLPTNVSSLMNSPKGASGKIVKDCCSVIKGSLICEENRQYAQILGKNRNNSSEKTKGDTCPKKRPRGRPRKIVNGELTSSTVVPSGPTTRKPGKRKYTKRKLLFTRMKRKSQTNLSVNVSNIDTTHVENTTTERAAKNPGGKLLNWTKSDNTKVSESSVFQDNDLDELLQSVKSSIKTQFKEEVSTDVIPNLTFDNPFALMQPPPFPKIARPSSPRIVKPKAKRPKLHVMMRQTKRRKKKLVTPKAAPAFEQKQSASPKLDVFSPVVTHPERTEKLSVPPLRKSGTFGSSMSLAKRPFFTSCVQPSKILASSRLNVFRLGTGVEEVHRAVTPPDTEAAESFEKRLKKRHKLLYRKSKHKNIIDPVFAADLDTLLEGLTGMTISENPSDNFIRVRPGEMPLPSIFRVIKIDVNRKTKERAFTPEPLTVDKSKIPKSTLCEPLITSFRPILKVGRKKITPEVMLEQHKRQAPVNDSSDQRLPPKKRHRMVNAETPQDVDCQAASEGDLKHYTVKKKGKRLRKVSGQDDSKSDTSQCSSRLGQQFVGNELTIDTSQGFLTCTPSLSPCASRLSTRSSTLPSLSSPSPTGSLGSRAQSLSHQHSSKASGGSSSGGGGLSLTCPLHSLAAANSTAPDCSECAECRLLEQSMASISPGSVRSGRFNLRSLSGQPAVSDFSSLSERRLSSAEPSPNLKLTPVFDKSLSRSHRKRHKSSNLSGDESDSSPPTLECILPQTSQDTHFFSEPPNIISSGKGPLLPKQTPCTQSPGSSKSSLPPSVSRKKKGAGLSLKRKKQARKTLSLKKLTVKPAKPSQKKKCNNLSSSTNTTSSSNNLMTKSSRSVITMSCPEHEPLPLEHCSNRKLVDEIKAATTLKSTELEMLEEGSECEDAVLPSPIQPPRKRYQRVGLFSDFYKDSDLAGNWLRDPVLTKRHSVSAVDQGLGSLSGPNPTQRPPKNSYYWRDGNSSQRRGPPAHLLQPNPSLLLQASSPLSPAELFNSAHLCPPSMRGLFLSFPFPPPFAAGRGY